VWLAGALLEAAWSAVHAKDTYLAAKFWRLAGPRTSANRRKKAAVAVAHKILIAAYHIMATPGEATATSAATASPAATIPTAAAAGSSPSSKASATTSH
jgi:hypothetical protein